MVEQSQESNQAWMEFQERLKNKRAVYRLGNLAINAVERLPNLNSHIETSAQERLLQSAAKADLWDVSLEALEVDDPHEHESKSYKRRFLTSEFNQLNLSFFWFGDQPQINLDWMEVRETRKIGPTITAITVEAHNFKMNQRLATLYTHKPYIYDYYNDNPDFRRLYPVPNDELSPQKFARGVRRGRLPVSKMLELSHEIKTGEEY